MNIPVSSRDRDLRECVNQLDRGAKYIKGVGTKTHGDRWRLSIGLRCVENALALLLTVVPGVREAEAIEEARGE